MSVAYGIDFAFYPHPPVAAIKAAGCRFVGRYISPQAANDANGKNLLAGELKAYRAAGLSLVLYAEQYAGRMREGAGAGKADAQHFAAVTAALAMKDAVMFCAADFDAYPGDQPAINAYLDGVAGVIGRGRTGLYGDYYVVERAFAAGKCRYAVQTVAWSGGQWTPKAAVRQGLYVNVGGVSCDVLTSMAADFGQWPRPGPVVPPAPTDYTADGVMTLADLGQAHGFTVGTLLWLMVKHRPNGFGPQQLAYIEVGDWHSPMPAGMRVWFA